MAEQGFRPTSDDVTSSRPASLGVAARVIGIFVIVGMGLVAFALGTSSFLSLQEGRVSPGMQALPLASIEIVMAGGAGLATVMGAWRLSSRQGQESSPAR